MVKKILIIEDDPKIRRYLQLELQHEGYYIDLARDGIEGIEKWKENSYNLILLDLMMPELSGEDVCEQIRKESEIPIIVLTAKDKTFSKISLLDLGADDYITKPFVIGELLARIRVAFRNKKEFVDSKFMTYPPLKLDLEKKIAYKDDEIINLTKTELNLLQYFILNREIVLSREQILTNVWGYDYLGGEKIVDVYIQALRKKMDRSEKKLIHTVRGFGYILKRDEAI
jgi:DNA-binding response OmpR family regulator